MAVSSAANVEAEENPLSALLGITGLPPRTMDLRSVRFRGRQA
jgi:hypothetical protein